MKNAATSSSPASPASTPRDLLVETALRLFRDRGFRATGIDLILAESGVAKKTLYRHFGSKDDLIVAALVRRDELWREWFRGAIKARGRSPAERLLAIFEALEEWFARSDFHGCMFINAAAEFPAHEDAIHAEAARHKRLVREIVRDLAEDAGAKDAGALADTLCLLMEGAIVTAQVEGLPAAQSARTAAAGILRAALNAGPAR
jgi:AcrR family transcriptional regulator